MKKLWWLLVLTGACAQASHVLEPDEYQFVTRSKLLDIDVAPARQLTPSSWFYKLTAGILIQGASADGYLCSQDMELLWYNTASRIPWNAHRELFSNLSSTGWKVQMVGESGTRVHYVFTRNQALVYAIVFKPEQVQKYNDVYDLLWCRARKL